MHPQHKWISLNSVKYIFQHQKLLIRMREANAHILYIFLAVDDKEWMEVTFLKCYVSENDNDDSLDSEMFKLI